jgi:caffeoyl-CoA O-methyltransferase
LIHAQRVVEVGTLAGFSAIALGRGMSDDGRLWTIEHDPKHAAVARDNIAAAGFADRITVVEGDGVDRLAHLEANGPFDVVFVDADKARYDQYGRWARAHLREGGLLLMDNAYLFGRLMEDSPAAAAMRRAHEEAAAHFDSVCIPTPDGLLLGIKRSLTR